LRSRAVEAFHSWAERTPAGEAVQLGNGSSTTYSELEQAVAEAESLVLDLVPRGGALAIHGSPDAALIALLLAALRAARPFVLLDPKLPLERRLLQLRASGASALIEFTSPHASLLPTHKPAVETALFGTKAIYRRTMLADRPYPAGAAYVFFTSGSTGQPKGVLGGIEGLDHFVDWQGKWASVQPQHRFGQLTRPSFDVFMRDVLTPLANGATLVVCDEEVRQSPQNVRTWLAQQRITHLHTVPTLARLIVLAKGEALCDLHSVFFAGEPLTAKLVEQWRTVVASDCRIVNLYGPTETTLAKFFHEVTDKDIARGGVMPVGKPLPGCEAVMLTPARTSSSSASGEVGIAVPYPVLGYLDKEQGSDRFFSLADGRRIYASGDLGTLLDGVLHLAGRADDEVKLGGVRINPAEVAAIAEELTFVSRAVCLAEKDSSLENRKRLCLFWVGTPAGDVQTDAEQAVRAHLGQRLPAAAVPALCMEVESFPLLPNGKADRAALFALAAAAQALEAQPLASEQERVLYRAWVEVLGDPGKRSDDFLVAGGDSLAAMEIAIAVEQRSAFVLGAADLFRFRLLSEIARLGMRESNRTIEQPSVRGPSKDYPLLRSQWGFFRFHVQGYSESWNNVTRRIRFERPRALESVRNKLVTLSERNAALRVRLVQNPALRQHVLESIEVPLATTNKSPETVESELRLLHFDVFQAPLWRAAACLRDGGVVEVVVAAHHIVVDGMSMQLIEDLVTDARSVQETQSVDYVDVICWDAEVRGSSTYRLDLEYATELFNEYHAPYQAPHDASSQGTSLPSVIEGEEMAALTRWLRRCGLPPSVAIHGLFQFALHRHFDTDRIVTGFLHHGREGPHMGQVIGNFASVRHLSTTLVKATSQQDFIEHVRFQHANALEHRTYEFIDVLDRLGVDSKGSRIPKSALFFNYLPRSTHGRPTERTRGAVPTGHDVKHDLMLHCSPMDEAMLLNYEYRNSVFTDATVTAVDGQLRSAIHALER
jgi:mycobactin peptide synthetase MbtE